MALPFVLGGCFIPQMTNMQSARTLKEGESRLTPCFAQFKNEESDSEPVYQIGGFLGVGVNDRLEWQFRFDRFTSLKGDDGGGQARRSVRTGAEQMGRVQSRFGVE